jgi:predicted ATPase
MREWHDRLSEEIPDGARLLDDVHAFLGRFIRYPSDNAHVAHTAHTHLMEAWDSTPRIAFLSPEPGSGKSRALETIAR